MATKSSRTSAAQRKAKSKKSNKKRTRKPKSSTTSQPASQAPQSPQAPQTPESPQTPNPNDPQNPNNAYQPPNPNSTVTNGSGTVQLQSTYDLDMQNIDAIETHAREMAQIEDEEGRANIEEANAKFALGERKLSDRGSLNKNLAYRGMGRGSTAIQQSTKMKNEHLTEQNQIAAQRKLASDSALARRTASKDTLAAKQKLISLERAKHTMDESGQNPTEGSQPEDSGVAPTTLPSNPAPTTQPSPATPTPAPTSSATQPTARAWKGKYRGPDALKGDKRRLAAWRKAGRPKVNKKNARNF